MADGRSFPDRAPGRAGSDTERLPRSDRAGAGGGGVDAAITAHLLAIAGGNRRSFAALYEKASPKLFGLILRITRDRGTAEDALQDTFVHIWQNAGRFDPARGPAMAWITVIARNRAVDLVRKRGRSTAGSEVGPEPLDAMADPSAAADGGLDVLALARCLGQLDDRGQELVLLAYFEGWTREELAQRIDAPVNSVKTWLRRGLIALRACLEGENDGAR
ncbi:MAG: sigma-70 family RNA polymerase sigma factor [Pseudomonadota bacterium]